MELKEFVSKTIIDLLQAVKDAQAVSAAQTVVPMLDKGYIEYAKLGLTGLQAVEFEVQVRVESSEGKEARIGVASMIVGNIGKSTTGANEHTATLRFKIPISFPAGVGKNG